MADINGLASTPHASGHAGETSAPRQEAGRAIRHRAQELTAQGHEVAAEYYQQGRQYMQTWQQQLESQVHEQPLQSALIAAGIGLMLGLLRRR